MSPPVLALTLLACSGRGETGTADTGLTGHSGPTEPRTWHLLVSADGRLSDDNPPLVELDAQLERVWSHDFAGLEGRGAEGIDRHPDGRTAYTRVQGSTQGGWIDVLDASGQLAWTWEGEGAGGLSFPHGVAFTPAGDLVIADTSAGRLISVDLAGQVLWEEPLPTTAPNGLDLWTDPDGQTHLLVTGRHALGVGLDDEELINRYQLQGRTESPTLTWSRVLEGEGSVSPHGPLQLDDGTALYCARGEHQIVALSADGDETWRSAVDAQVLDAPQGLAWADGALFVADSGAGRLLRFDDPFGAFENTASAAVDSPFEVQAVTCGPDAGPPCY